MKPKTAAIILTGILIAMRPYGVFSQTNVLSFKAGAAKVDITPTQLPKNSEGILDHIYARAIVIDNGATSAALVSIDTGMLYPSRLQRIKHVLETVEIELDHCFTVRSLVLVAGVGQYAEGAVDHVVLDVAVDFKTLLTGNRAAVMLDIAEIVRARQARPTAGSGHELDGHCTPLSETEAGYFARDATNSSVP